MMCKIYSLYIIYLSHNILFVKDHLRRCWEKYQTKKLKVGPWSLQKQNGEMGEPASSPPAPTLTLLPLCTQSKSMTPLRLVLRSGGEWKHCAHRCDIQDTISSNMGGRDGSVVIKLLKILNCGAHEVSHMTCARNTSTLSLVYSV